MSYPPLLHLATEAEYRARFERVYCQGPVMTFDGVAVRFRKSQFDHCFFESTRRNRIKDQFSWKRAQRLEWIAAALGDSNSERYVGWDNRKKRYDKRRRVAIVMGNYVVVITLTGAAKADFVTAYVADTPPRRGRPSTIQQIRSGPKWT